MLDALARADLTFLLGFFVALALRRKRLTAVIDRLLALAGLDSEQTTTTDSND